MATKHVGLVQNGHYHNVTYSPHYIAEKVLNLALNNNHTLSIIKRKHSMYWLYF